MKKLLLYPILSLTLVLSGCGAPSGRRLPINRQNLSPDDTEFTLNENQEPVTAPSSAFERELERLREQGSTDVARIHQETVEENNRMAFQDRPESDRLDFRNMQATFLENGQIKATFDVVYLENGEEKTERVEFISPETILGDEFSFTVTQAFSLRDIVLKGACIDGFQTCNELVLEPAYYLEDMKVGRHFVAYRPTEEQVLIRIRENEQASVDPVEETEDAENIEDIEDAPVRVQVAPSPEEVDEEQYEEDDELDAGAPQQQNLSIAPDVMSEAPAQPSAPEISEEGSINISIQPDTNNFNRQAPQAPPAPSQVDNNINIDTSPPPTVEVMDVQPEAPEAADGVDVTAPEVSRDGELNIDRRAPRRPDMPRAEINFQSPEQVAMTNAPELPSAPTIEESPALNIRTLNTPVVRSVRPNAPHRPEINTSLDIDTTPLQPPQPLPQAPEILTETPDQGEVPTAREDAVVDVEIPVTEESDVVRIQLPQAPVEPSTDDVTISVQDPEASNSEIVQIPISEDTPEDDPDAEVHDPEVSVSSGHFFIRSTEERDQDVDVFFNLNAGAEFPIHLQPTAVENELLSDILNKSYEQARGEYTSGSIRDSVQLPREMVGAVVNPDRDHHQWGSGLTLDFIQYTASRFERMNSGEPFCINNISREGGGNTPSHSSHENGLDIDISYPSSANQCRSARDFFIPWEDLADSDPLFLERNWDFLKFLLVDDEVKNRITIIFSDKDFMKSLCTWAKNSGKEQANIESIITKLYHQTNHHHHYHIRMVCNLQNVPCVPQNSYTRESKRVDPGTCR